ncbi:hypothetical protein PHMEG_000656 [Phytophthora megakarya]|uniref:Uncharacterized protein n=1 Tax=Phytophthora megakarya TaxID=4795 RepID=A0A225X337_9STRA|nr:hypothetical protein PHMEG_000656 [Phytophthora megakarya]
MYSARGGLRSLVEVATVCVFATSSGQVQATDTTTARGLVGMASCGISDGDKAVGIRVIIDATCAVGGLGCYNDHCRYCKVVDTLQSAHFSSCMSLDASFTTTEDTEATSIEAVVSGSCAMTVSAGDAAVGINITTDASCANGGVGCIDNICRFCRVTTTTQSAQYNACPAAPTPTPTSTSGKQSCSQTVSDGDAAVGIKIVTDTSCNTGGIGCIDQVCRFCRVTTTPQSASFVECTTIQSTTAPRTASPTTASPTTISPAKTPTATTSAPGTAIPSTVVCTTTAAAGDIAAGINIFTDVTCVSGGLGCIDNVCRFCKTKSTTQSASYPDCSTIGGTTVQAPVATPAPTPTAVTSSSTPSIIFDCLRTVSSGDKGVGLDVVSDIRCSEGGTGCLDEVCRFCKRFDTVQSQSYLDCSSIPSSNIGSDITFVPIPVVDDSEPTMRMIATESGEATTPGVSPSTEDNNTLSAGVSRSDAGGSNISVEAGASNEKAPALFENATIQWVVVGAVCVGAVAIVGLAVFGIKRTIGTLKQTSTPPDKEKVTPEDEDRPSVLTTSNVDEPGIVRDV